MKVSIIIPVYNAEKFLDECIDSAINQTYENIEIIAVNDGSTDNSKKILDEYSSKIKIINRPNGGTPSALNSGIKIMTGDWFKWLSADDVMNKNCVETIIKKTEELGKDANNCIFYSNFEYIDEKSKVIGQYIEPDLNQLDSLERNVMLLDYFYGNGSTSLIHKSVFEKCGMFDEKIGYQEDYEFWLRCCLLNNMKLHLVPQILVQYRVHSSQLTQKNFTENIKNAKIIRNIIMKKLDPNSKILYNNALKKLKKQKPLKLKIRRKTRDVLIDILPNSISNKILKIYLNQKNE